MGDSLKKKHYGVAACLTRTILALCVIFMSYYVTGLFWVIVVLNVIGMILAGCIRAKHLKATVNGVELDKKERRNLFRRYYIYTIVIV